MSTNIGFETQGEIVPDLPFQFDILRVLLVLLAAMITSSVS